MCGNNENGGGCARECCRRFLDLLHRIRKIRYCLCCLRFLLTLGNHLLASGILSAYIGFTIVSFFIYELPTSLSVSFYCFCLIICACVSRVCKKGKSTIKKLEEARKKERRREEVDQPTRELSDGTERLQIDDPNIMYQGPGMDVVIEGRPGSVHVEIDNADQPSESSNLAAPTSSTSDEPLQQAEPSDSGSNLPRSSTDPSTQSTSISPSECHGRRVSRTQF